VSSFCSTLFDRVFCTVSVLISLYFCPWSQTNSL